MKTQNVFTFTHEGREYTIKFDDFQEMDITEAVTIHHENIFAESVMQPLLLHQLGTIKAFAQKEVQELEMLHKHNLKSLNQQRDKALATAEADYYTDSAAYNGKKITAEIAKSLAKVHPNVQDIESKIMDAEHNAELMQAQTNLSIIEAAYWALKDKGEHIKTIRSAVGVEESTSSFKNLQSGIEVYGSKLKS